MIPEPGKCYRTDDLAAEWLNPAETIGGQTGWLVVRFGSAGSFVGVVYTVEQLLAEFPEFAGAVEA